MYSDLSIDIETFDTEDSAVVLSVGAAAFNLHEQSTVDDFTKENTYYAVLNRQQQIDLQRTVSDSVLSFWFTQKKDAQKVLSAPQQKVELAMHGLMKFAEGHRIQRVWGNGNMFDNGTLRSLCKDFDIDWMPHMDHKQRYRSDMDLRTLRVAAGEPPFATVSGLIAHNALDDAIYQAICAQQYMREIKGTALPF